MLTVLMTALLSVASSATDVPGPWMAPAARCEALAGRLRIAPELKALVADMCRRAPTFRRQVVRLAREPGLDVTVSRGRFALGGRMLARTAMTRLDGQLRTASVEVPGGDPMTVVELLAHELEHIVEQLDGVELASWAGRSGVTRVGGFDREAPFETERARQIGRRVAGEYLAADAELTAFKAR
jgi:hypothetical protein